MPAVTLRSLLVAALLVPAAGAGAGDEPARLVVGRQSIEDLKPVFATVASGHLTKARTRRGGTLEAVAAVEGDKVAAGQVLALVADPKLALQLAALDARINSFDAQLRQAGQELERARQLRQSGTGSQQRLDDAQTALDVVAAQLAAQRAERAVIEEQVREGRVLAPTAGRVLQIEAVAGSVVMAGEAIATLATDDYVLRLMLPERHARFLKPGAPVLVGERGLGATLAETGAEGRDGPLRQGAIGLVYPQLADGRVVADAEVTGLGDYFVGERVRVLVATGRRETVVVPRAYVFRRFSLDYVHRAEGGDTVVQTGPAVGDDGVEILSGLRPGDVLVRP